MQQSFAPSRSNHSSAVASRNFLREHRLDLRLPWLRRILIRNGVLAAELAAQIHPKFRFERAHRDVGFSSGFINLITRPTPAQPVVAALGSKPSRLERGHRHRHHRGRSCEHRHVHALAASGPVPRFEREQNSDDRLHRPSGEIGNLNPGQHRRRILRAHQIENARKRQIVDVVARERRITPMRAVAGERGVDQPGIRRPQRFITQAEPFHHAGPEAFDHDVGGRGEIQKSFLAARVLQIDFDALFAAIGERENRVFPVLNEAVPRVVAGARLFDLDDLRAEVHQPLRRHRAGQKPRQIQNRNAVESLQVRYNRTFMRNKVTVVGGGNVGASCAMNLALKELADVVLVDVVEGVPIGKGLDMLESGPIEGYDVRITGANDYEPTANSDVVVITAGLARKPGMSRDDLLLANYEVVQSRHRAGGQAFAQRDSGAGDQSSGRHVLGRRTRFRNSRRHRVIGMAGVLDSARFRTFIAAELNVSVENVTAVVLGGHGDTMVPVVRLSNVSGIPLTELMDKATLDKIVERTRTGGAEIVKYLKTGSAYYAPSAAAVEMVESILKDKKKVLPCAAYLEGEYGIQGLFVGVPVKLGSKGIEKIYEIKLNDEEKAMLAKSAAAVQELIDVLKPKM